MANLVLMPQMGISEESAILGEWLVRQGDSVAVGDKIFMIETGKSTFEIESEFAGVVLALYAEPGDEIPIKHPVCAIGEAGEEVAAAAPPAAQPSEQTAQPDSTARDAGAPISAPAAPPVAGPAAHAGAGVSPRARMLAEKAGVDPRMAAPTGAEGRVIERDVRALIESGRPAAADAAPAAAASVSYTDKPMTHLRKIIAKNMMASMQNTAQLTHSASFDATAILAARKTFKSDPATAGVTLGDMVLFVVSRTLPAFPALNAWLLDETMRYFDAVNLAVAVDTEKGLLVPVIFGASGKSLTEISNEMKALAQNARAGTISPDLLSGGSFTVSNLGSFGVEHFTPILNAPQTGILGVNTITQRVRASETGIQVYPGMGLSLTYDHRAVDGAPASLFLQTLCKNLENFQTYLD